MSGNDSFTKLLLHCDGADASTSFPDASPSGHTVTASGNAQVDTAQSKFGGASALFDGAGDYLSLDGSADFAFGTGDFAIDFWLRLNATGVFHILYDSRGSGVAGGLNPEIFVDSSNKLVYFTNGAVQITGTTSIASGAWYHAAVARSGTSTKLFLNGVQEGATYSDSHNYIVGTSRPTIGISGFDVAASPLNGWIDELRVSKGIARWTANFTPPAAPYSSNTFVPFKSPTRFSRRSF